MNNKDKGILIYSEWFEAMKSLNNKEFRSLMTSIYRYQIADEQPEEFEGRAKVLASVIFPCIERRKKQAGRGRLGGLATAARANRSNEESPETPPKKKIRCFNLTKALSRSDLETIGVATGIDTNTSANSTANSTADSTADSQSIVENSIAENNIAEYSRAEYSRAPKGRGIGNVGFIVDPDIIDGLRRMPKKTRQDAPDNAETRAPEEKESEKRGNGYGVYGNVYLSTEEYLMISEKIPDANGYIDRFSRKLHDRGYRYNDHAKTLLEWWERDKEYEKRREAGEKVEYDSEPPRGSFDTDSFFEAAVRRSLEMAEKSISQSN